MLNLFNFDLIVISTTDVSQKDSPYQCYLLLIKKKQTQSEKVSMHSKKMLSANRY